jgi:hypothetical protein
MLPACWKNNRLKKSVVQIITKNSYHKCLVKMAIHQNWLSHQKNFHLGLVDEKLVKNVGNLNQNCIKNSRFTLISEIIEKLPLWADFSKSALQIFSKWYIFFHMGVVFNQFQEELE